MSVVRFRPWAHFKIMKKKIALITGITGQDGAYLANLLLNKGYKVYGTYRRSSSLNLWRLQELGIIESIELLSLELLEKSNIERVVKLIKPDEFYNLAAQSFVSLSFENPIYTAQADAIGVLNILESIRIVDKKIKFYQASSSEMFGGIDTNSLNENSKFGVSYLNKDSPDFHIDRYRKKMDDLNKAKAYLVSQKIFKCIYHKKSYNTEYIFR